MLCQAPCSLPQQCAWLPQIHVCIHLHYCPSSSPTHSGGKPILQYSTSQGVLYLSPPINREDIEQLHTVKTLPLLSPLPSQDQRVCCQCFISMAQESLQNLVPWLRGMEMQRLVSLPGGVGSLCWSHWCSLRSCYLFAWQQPFSG